jgi:hypothetical protein
MTDSTLNRFLASGTNAERLAFTPSPPTPASGPDPTYVWHETDTSNTYCWNFDSSSWIKINNAPTSTTPNAVTFNNSGSGAASGTNFDGSAAQTISYNTIGAQPSDATLTALSAVAWSAGTQVLTLTAADTFTLKTVGIAAGNILDKTAGDTLYQTIGSYQPLDSTLTDLAGLSYTSNALKVVRVNAGETGFELATIASGTTNNALTFSNTGGAAVGATFDGSAAKTVDYSTVGALGKANNLSDLNSASTARTNLGLGTIAVEDEATAAQIRAGTASKAVAADKLQSAMAVQTLTDGTTVSWDMSTAINAKVTLGGNRTLAVSNPVLGATYSLGVIQDATGSRTVTWPSSFDWGTTGAPTLTTTASKRDRITVFCTDASTPKFDAFLSGKGFS